MPVAGAFKPRMIPVEGYVAERSLRMAVIEGRRRYATRVICYRTGA